MYQRQELYVMSNARNGQRWLGRAARRCLIRYPIPEDGED
jgi:hypothetical protein